MGIITLTSDWHSVNYYSAAVKGRLYALCPGATILDITDKIKPFSITEAAFIVRNSAKHFQSGTIHLLAVDAEFSEKKPLLAVKAFDQYFVGADNGMFGLLLGEEVQNILRINIPESDISTFPELDNYTNLVASIYKKDFGNIDFQELNSFYRPSHLLPTIETSFLLGQVIFIDNYENVITNISEEIFEEARKGRQMTIFVQSRRNKIEEISTHYGSRPEGSLLALFNSAGLLEIAIYKSTIAELLNLSINSQIRINFYDNQISKDGIQSGTLF